jgi:hypothetical protein
VQNVQEKIARFLKCAVKRQLFVDLLIGCIHCKLLQHYYDLSIPFPAPEVTSSRGHSGGL